MKISISIITDSTIIKVHSLSKAVRKNLASDPNYYYDQFDPQPGGDWSGADGGDR